jgi:inorganic pyrophosphatase
MNAWHNVSPGKKLPELLDCIIEIPRGSHNKYEMDKASGLLRFDRVLYSAVFYPANYGFIPQTYCDDCDPLDILVLGPDPVPPMCIMTARPIGVMQMKDKDEEDDKIIAIHEHDPAYKKIREIEDLPEHTLLELQRFFKDYKKLEHGNVRVELMLGKEDAHEIVERSVELYNASFEPGGKPRSDAPTVGKHKR